CLDRVRDLRVSPARDVAVVASMSQGSNPDAAGKIDRQRAIVDNYFVQLQLVIWIIELRGNRINARGTVRRRRGGVGHREIVSVLQTSNGSGQCRISGSKRPKLVIRAHVQL